MTLNDLQNAVAPLLPDELAKFRAWFVEFDADAWDRQIEDNAEAGRLDALPEEALRDHREGE